MTHTQTVIAAIGVLVVAMLSMILLVSGQRDVEASPSWISNITTVATTSTAISVPGLTTRILATTTNPLGVPGVSSNVRVFASICNPSSTIVYLNMDRDEPADNTHAIKMIGAAAGYDSCYEITDRNLYQGSVQASSTAGAVNVFVTEYVQ